MFLFKNEIQFQYKGEFLNNGSICYTNMMSSKYAKYTEEHIKNIHSEGILVPLIVYSDGVALGLRKKVSIKIHTKCYK